MSERRWTIYVCPRSSCERSELIPGHCDMHYSESPEMQPIVVIPVPSDSAELSELRKVTEGLVGEADNLRFQLDRVLRGAVVLGDTMDAPVKLEDLEAVELNSMRTFLKRYDEARSVFDGEREDQRTNRKR